MLQAYPKLEALKKNLDAFLKGRYPEFFGKNATHPVLKLRRSKVIHDNLWGTKEFSWRELALIDTPLFQRLKLIHQTGLAYQVYPSAHHTRFEHSLGVCVMASRTFDALMMRRRSILASVAKDVGTEPAEMQFAIWRQNLRLAALLHDLGHSLHSHTSEQVYSKLDPLRSAAKELSEIVGLDKGEGEVLSFCLSQTDSVRSFLTRIEESVEDGDEGEEEVGVDLDQVSLLIVGRSKHPRLQFLADIISSDLDADKLDYLARDAAAAGLPLNYDLERYLYAITVRDDILADDEGKLQKLYKAVGTGVTRRPSDNKSKYPYYEFTHLRLTKQGVNTIEQMVICKFMLFTYIYHHKKVRAAEGLLARLLGRLVVAWKKDGLSDLQILERFLGMTDHSLSCEVITKCEDEVVQHLRARLEDRLIPREVYGFVMNLKHKEGPKIKAFMSEVLKPEKKSAVIDDFEKALSQELQKLRPQLGKTDDTVLANAGAWLDVPKEPTFKKIEKMLIGSADDSIEMGSIFPASSWIQAYIGYRYKVRVFAFSEHMDAVEQAARNVCKTVMGITDDSVFDLLKQKRH